MTGRRQSDTQDAMRVPRWGVHRILGVYPQKQDGKYMQRIKVFAGRIDWVQWRQLAYIARDHAGGFPLHLTTRQDIELHDIAESDVTAVQKKLADVGLPTLGACGDSIRNVTVCPGCEFGKEGFDLLPLAQEVRRILETDETAADLPRKFKVSFSGCSNNCAKPWISDLGLVAESDGAFTAIGAGSLGAKPGLGIELYRGLSPTDVQPLCLAALDLFAQHGDRKNRRRARFRHIRERFGDDAFKAELSERFERKKASRTWPRVTLARVKKNARRVHRLQLPNGNIGPDEALLLADVCEPAELTLRINLEHGLELYGRESVSLPGPLPEYEENPVIIACPGSRTCPRGLVDCWEGADQIRKQLAGRIPADVKICISGCPNGCAHSAAADIGLVGMLRKRDGQPAEHYRILTGGGNGTNDRLAQPLATVPAEKVPKTIVSWISERQQSISDRR